MPQTIELADGTTTEVLTPEEIDAEKQAAIEAYKAANPDKTEELTKLQEELTKLKGKDLNFENLRKQKEDAEKKIEEIIKGVPAQIETAKKEILETVLKDHYSETLKTLAGDDEELKKKVEYHYKRLADTAGTKEEVTKKLTDAYVLATKPDDPNALTSQVVSSGGVHKLNIKTNQPFTQDEKELARKMAAAGGMTLKDEDFK